MSVILIDEQIENENVKFNDNVTRVVFLLDETGSMNVVKDKTIKGYNEYIQTLKQKIENVYMSLITFNSCNGISVLYDNILVSNVPELDEKIYKPNCGTPLYDAIGRAIVEGEKVANESDNVLIIIQTDGEENTSVEYTLESIRSMIKDKEKLGWTFVCLGADIDAWGSIGKSLGLSRGNAMSYKGSDSKNMFASLAFNTVNYCSNNISSDDSKKNNFFQR